MKLVLILTIMSLSSISAKSYAQSFRGPQLTDTQRTCLESKLGKPGQGARPTREQMDSAMSECGVERPDFSQERRQGPPQLQLTDDQKTCLEGQIGKPGQGSRPSREQMEAAFETCGIEKPALPDRQIGGGFDSRLNRQGGGYVGQGAR